MDLSNGILIGRVRGIAIRVHWSWVFVFTLLTWALATGFFGQQFPEWEEAERWVAASLTAVMFFLSVLLHELSHAFVALAYRMRVPSITLFIFGGVSSIDGEMETPGQEFRVAIAGPAMSVALGVLFMTVALVIPSENVARVVVYLGSVNFVLAIFNLLPGFPLDGGRVLRSIVWRRTGDLTEATRLASAVGSGIAWLLIGLGIVSVLTIGLIGLWYVLIGLFLKSAAEGAYQHVLIERTLRGVRAVDIMRPLPETLPEGTDLQTIVDERVLGRGERAIFLEHDGRVTGLLTLANFTKVPRAEWSGTAASEVMMTTQDIVTVDPETSVMETLRLMGEKDIHQVPVLSGDRMVGLLNRGDILQQIETRMSLAQHGSK